MNPKDLEVVEDETEKYRVAYVAGMIDGSSTITANVYRDEDYRHDYRIDCRVQVARQLPFALQELEDYCVEKGIWNQLVEEKEGEKYVFVVSKNHDIEMFLKQIFPYLRDKREEASLLATEIVPEVEMIDKMSKKRFVETVRKVDELREVRSRLSDAKYTAEFFQEEWEL